MESRIQRIKITIRNLLIFTTIVSAIGWIGRRLDVLMGNRSTDGIGMLLWITMPLVVSLLLRSIAGDGWKDFGIKPNFKGNVIWYIISLLIYPLLTIFVLIFGWGLGITSFPNLSLNTIRIILQTFLLSLLPQFIKNILEEAAWRGYLAPKVYSLSANDFVGHVIVGLVWGTWHIPYYLFFLDRAILQDFTSLNMTVFIPLTIMVMISWAMVYGEIFLLTKSIWPLVLMHIVEDAFLNQLFTGHHIHIRPGKDWLISPVYGLVSILCFIIVGIWLHYIRKRKKSNRAGANHVSEINTKVLLRYL
jgi:hypothetical protein